MGALGRMLELLRGIGALIARGFTWIKATTWGQWLIFYLLTFLGGIIGKIFLLLGVTLVVNRWVTPELTPMIANHLLGMPPEWIDLLALTKIDQAITIVLSAIGIAMADRVFVRRKRNAWQQPL